MTQDIETIGIADLFGPPSPARDRTDASIMAAASGIGFMAVRDFPGDAWLTPDSRAQLLRIFALPDTEKQKLLRWNFVNGWISKLQGPSLNAGGNDVAIEAITIVHEGLTRIK